MEKMYNFLMIMQVESHPYLSNSKLFELCKKHGIQPVGYSPLGSATPESGQYLFFYVFHSQYDIDYYAPSFESIHSQVPRQRIIIVILNIFQFNILILKIVKFDLMLTLWWN